MMVRALILAAAGAALALWLRAGSGAPVPYAVTVAAQLERVESLAELRLISTEIDSYQEAAIPGGAALKAIVPVTLVVGIDLRKVRVYDTAPGVLMVIPPPKILSRSTDHARWQIWDETGDTVGGELQRLVYVQAEVEADQAARAMNVMDEARERAAAALKNVAVAAGVPAGQVTVVVGRVAPAR